ncbi:MAG: hypothetical protein WC365_01510 [Candidatus Babeliales bacterium]|jgi:hypothetical protein
MRVYDASGKLLQINVPNKLAEYTVITYLGTTDSTISTSKAVKDVTDTLATKAEITDLAPLADPTFTGVPAAPTAAPGTNTTQIATTAHVKAADDLKANLASPALTGTPTAPTAAPGTNTTQIATTAHVKAANDLKANLASPGLTGVPTAPTAAVGTNTTQLATTAFVKAEIAAGSAVPSGLIAMWYSSIASIPSGWVLCNGSSSTPDLRDKFVVGAGSTYAVADEGGEATHTLTTAEMPAHTHGVPNVFGTGTAFGILVGGSHIDQTPITSGSAGSGSAHENRPPYYAIVFMMKT